MGLVVQFDGTVVVQYDGTGGGVLMGLVEQFNGTGSAV